MCACQVISDITLSEKQRLPLLPLVDSLGSALRAAAQPDLLRRAWASLRTQRAPGTNPVSLPFPANSVYLLALREAMKAALTDKQSYDAAFMSGLAFFPPPPFFLPPECLSQLSVLFPQPWALLTQESVTPHTGESGTCRRPLLFMRQRDPLCHPLSARGVCLHRRSPRSLYQPGAANEKHQVNTTTRTATALKPLNSFRHC